MFGSIGWGEMMILLVAALVILGPDRLPGAITWVTKAIRQAKEYASGASQQLKDELGTDFEDFRQPLADLKKLRGMTPRAAITKHLLDGDDSIFTSTRDALQNGAASIKEAASLNGTPTSAPAPSAPAPAATGPSSAEVSLTKPEVPSTRADSELFAEPVDTVKPVSPGGPVAQPVAAPATAAPATAAPATAAPATAAPATSPYDYDAT